MTYMIHQDLCYKFIFFCWNFTIFLWYYDLSWGHCIFARCYKNKYGKLLA